MVDRWQDLIGVPQCMDAVDLMRMLPDGCIDAIITDPPYPKRYQYTYRYLAEGCPRIMRGGASLFMLVGHYALPEIVKIFDNALKYRWVISMNQEDGSHPRMAMGIEVTWKPVLWYVKDAYPQGRGFVRDSFKVTGRKGQVKELHKWQQDDSWAEFFIAHFTQPGDLVLDPLAGSFTTARVAQRLGRRWICGDNCAEYVDRFRTELAQPQQAELSMPNG